jgi:hypothetical protein
VGILQISVFDLISRRRERTNLDTIYDTIPEPLEKGEEIMVRWTIILALFPKSGGRAHFKMNFWTSEADILFTERGSLASGLPP